MRVVAALVLPLTPLVLVGSLAPTPAVTLAWAVVGLLGLCAGVVSLGLARRRAAAPI